METSFVPSAPPSICVWTPRRCHRHAAVVHHSWQGYYCSDAGCSYDRWGSTLREDHGKKPSPGEMKNGCAWLSETNCRPLSHTSERKIQPHCQQMDSPPQKETHIANSSTHVTNVFYGDFIKEESLNRHLENDSRKTLSQSTPGYSAERMLLSDWLRHFCVIL